MWQKQKMSNVITWRRRGIFIGIALGLLGLLLVGCGGTGSMNASTSSGGVANSAAGGTSNGSTQDRSTAPQSASNAGGQKSTTGHYGPQYLVKTLQVTMEVQNPLQSASELQQWVAFNDPQSTSDGSDYENVGNGYAVTLTFLVDIAHYTQVQAYLRDYAGQKGHSLTSLKETVQDVTNDYVDTQSTLTNLRAEQQRLLTFMSQAQNVTDALNVEQQLTQVEGQIDQIEAHLNALKGQTTFYTVTVTVQPVGSAPPPPSPWSIIPIWQGAWSSVVTVGQGLVAVLIWLLAYSVYIIPIGILIWLLRKRPWQVRRAPQVKSTLAFATPAASALAPIKTPAPAETISQPPESEDITHPVAVPPIAD